MAERWYRSPDGEASKLETGKHRIYLIPFDPQDKNASKNQLISINNGKCLELESETEI